jgi:hypothetical protein
MTKIQNPKSKILATVATLVGGLLVLLDFLAPRPTAAAEVRLRSSVACTAAVVRLADVAEIRADEPALVEALGILPICPAPAAGIERTLAQHQVRQLLALSGLDIKKVLVTGSDHVALVADSNPSAARRITSVDGSIRQALYSVEAPTTSFTRDVRPAANSLASVSSDSESLRLVEKGGSVTVTSRRPGVQITTSGKALQAGVSGETISVELAESKEKVLARVVGPQMVEVAGQNATTTPKPN